MMRLCHLPPLIGAIAAASLVRVGTHVIAACKRKILKPRSARSAEFSGPGERIAWEKFQRQKQSEETRRAAGPAVTDTSVKTIVCGGRLDRPLNTTIDHAPPEFQPPGSTRGSSRGSSRTDQTPQFHSTMLRALANA
jgi:hypothetical protein